MPRRIASLSRSASMSCSATAVATIPAVFWVPLRRSRSWPPPMISASTFGPPRSTRTPTPFGPPNLWALSESRSTCGVISRRSSQHAPWTASVWTSASGAWRRTIRLASTTSVIVPTSLLTAITLTIDTSGPSSCVVSSSSPAQRVEIDAARVVDTDDHTTVMFDRVQDGMVLGSRTHRDATAPADGTGHGHVVALGTATREHDLAGSAPDDRRHRVARLVDRPARLAGEAVRARRVGVRVGEVRQHRLDRLGAHRRGRGMIQVGDPVGRRIRARRRHRYEATGGPIEP